jgi:hypothetical protein
VGLLALFVALFAATNASAQGVDDATRGAARQLGDDGIAAFQSGDFPAASTKLEKAYAIWRVPTMGLWSARALVKVGKLVEARERYLEVESLLLTETDTAAQEEAKRTSKLELESLAPRIPNLIVVLEGAQPNEVTVHVDGAPLPAVLIGEKRPVNPGRHEIVGQKGSERVATAVDVKEGVIQAAALRFTATAAPVAAVPPPAAAPAQPAPSASSGRRMLAWTAIGLGGAGLVTGTVTGLIVLATENEFEESESCRGTECLPNELDRVKTYNNLRGVSTVSFIAGGVLTATGVVLLITEKRPAAPSAELVIGPRSAFVRGRF